MNFFDSRDTKLLIIMLCVGTVICTGISLFIGIVPALCVLVCSLFFSAIALVHVSIRNRKLNDICGEIDKILAGSESYSFSDYEEGELAVLSNEVNKLTMRLRQQNDVLRKDKLALADALADITHQLRTPLTSINLVINKLRNASDDSERKRLVIELRHMLSRMEWLISALLRLSKLDAGAVEMVKQSVDVRQLVEKAIEPVEIEADLRSISLVTDIPVTHFIGDMQWSIEAVGNIITNGIRHTPDNGTITVKASENAVYTEITVTDTGTGISDKDMPHIFERFYNGSGSAVTAKSGFGIGLALAKAIIAEQNGSITAKNVPDGGACFTIRFYKSIV